MVRARAFDQDPAQRNLLGERALESGAARFVRHDQLELGRVGHPTC